MRRRFGLRGLAGAGVAAMVAATLAACGGSSGGGSAGGAAAAGTPVKLMIIAPTGTPGTNYPEMVAAARAAVRGVNARGGISGHPVELEHCNEKNDPAAAKKCAQQAVDDKVLAVVAEVSGSGGIMPILQNAGIPSIGSSGVSADGSELSSPISYVISPLTFYPAVCPSLLAKAGAGRIGLVGYDLSASDRLITMAEGGGKAVNHPIDPKIRIPITTSDFTPAISQLTRSGADGAVLVVFDQAAYAVIGKAGQQIRTCHAGGTLSPKYLATLGPAADKLVIATAFPELSQAAQFPEVARMVRELEAEQAAGDPDAAPALRTTTTTTGAWLSVQIAEKVGSQVSGELTAKNLLAQLGRTKHLDLGGIVPPLDLTATTPIPGAERIFNTTLRGARWDSASKSFVPLGTETYDGLAILRRAAS
ncbi:ABC-type branched-chain amino acid transport system, periplasmic component [Frankia canadensis]|uniref:ABC-type branched-chain amino acid transport system, periplasmic component n=1 Tax=Frankia canadensis TaxID=1836972 RepID=A0A2I2KNX1_9ACTN|nr:ABC transporter substrate-binding protein [Frankia canadensis]SNQ47368.1 ABC-type branched-chain amino acid transport system, periplasmic component [Frankia canadensis]SOU54658.1 ABC-type branched-chain amino acid transport system, periplasmic component [Frankia canadensis]